MNIKHDKEYEFATRLEKDGLDDYITTFTFVKVYGSDSLFISSLHITPPDCQTTLDISFHKREERDEIQMVVVNYDDDGNADTQEYKFDDYEDAYRMARGIIEIARSAEVA